MATIKLTDDVLINLGNLQVSLDPNNIISSFEPSNNYEYTASSDSVMVAQASQTGRTASTSKILLNNVEIAKYGNNGGDWCPYPGSTVIPLKKNDVVKFVISGLGIPTKIYGLKS